MAATPDPMTTPAASSLLRERSPRLTVARAKRDARMASASDATVALISYPTAMGKVKAIMPIKCIDHIPIPMAQALPASQTNRQRLLTTALSMAALSSAVNDARKATTIDRHV